MPINCPFCKFEIPDGATVCGHCGAYSQNIKQLGIKGCITIPLAIVGGAAAGALACLIIMLAANEIMKGAAMHVMFFGWFILPLAGAILAVKLLPGRKEPTWYRKHV